MDILLIRNGVVRACITADSVAQATLYYPLDLCMQNPWAYQVGDLYNNGVFSPIIHLTAAEIEAQMTDAVQSQLDSTAQSYGYDSILSAVSYRDSTVPKFATDGVAFSAWRDACWSHCLQVLADVQAGTRSVPTVAQLLLELPAYVAP
jgi:hypothetical protein